MVHFLPTETGAGGYLERFSLSTSMEFTPELSEVNS